MARWRCVCGEVIRSSGEIPNPVEWHVIHDPDVEILYESGAPSGPAWESKFLDVAVYLYRCPVSDHLWIFWDGIGSAPSLYGPQALPSSEGW